MASDAELFHASKLIAEVLRPPPDCPHQFQLVTEDRYRLTLETLGTYLEIDRLRRDRGELIGELAVYCDLPWIQSFEGAVSIGDFNLSSVQARSTRAKLLTARAAVDGLDWLGLLEEFCQRVLAAERSGSPGAYLHTFSKPKTEDTLKIGGIVLPRNHPAILFGDGGAAKSYTALYIAGRLSKSGLSVALFDWELSGSEHRDRLERLFGDPMPNILYARCKRPLSVEAERLSRMVREKKIDYAIYDSISFACDGPPESAEVASDYLRALGQIGVGSLNVAHISKAEGADQKPFGSAFWHNGARSTWFAKCNNSSDHTIDVGFFHRKSNLGRLHQPTSFEITFTDEATIFRQTNPGDVDELASQLTVKQRMIYLLKTGSKKRQEIADELNIEIGAVHKVVQRSKTCFAVLDGGLIGLLSP